jgi:hypothetical protein
MNKPKSRDLGFFFRFYLKFTNLDFKMNKVFNV